MTQDKVSEYIISTMETDMKDNGKMICLMEREERYSVMDRYFKGIGSMMRDMERVFLRIKMGILNNFGNMGCLRKSNR